MPATCLMLSISTTLYNYLCMIYSFVSGSLLEGGLQVVTWIFVYDLVKDIRVRASLDQRVSVCLGLFCLFRIRF